MNPGSLVLLIPILALLIPIIAIVLSSVEKMYQLRLKHKSSGSAAEMEEMKQRMREMEQRIQTLQEIVISTDYEASHKIKKATAEFSDYLSAPSSATVKPKKKQKTY